MRTEQVSGVILAGGFSRRMGRDKAALRLGGRTMIEIQTEKLRRIGIRDLILSGFGRALPGTRAVPDIYPHLGPLSGLHACLRAAENPACLVLSVDTPLVPEETLRALIEGHREGSGITALRHGDRTEPLIAVYDSCLSDTVEQMLLEERRAVMRLLDACEVREILYAGEAALLSNCNTPEEFERLETLWKKNTF